MNKSIGIIALLLFATMGLKAKPKNGDTPIDGGKTEEQKTLPKGFIEYHCAKGCKWSVFGKCQLRDYDYKVIIKGWKWNDTKTILLPCKSESNKYDYSNLRGGTDKGLNDAKAKYEALGGLQCNWEIVQTQCFLEDAKKDKAFDIVEDFFSDMVAPDIGNFNGGGR